MIIILDLDYTLLTSEGIITQKTIDVLKKCKQRGDKIIINSARSLVRSKEFADLVDADYINCYYGNLIVDKEGEILYKQPFDRSLINGIYNDFMKIHKDDFAVEAFDGAYTPDNINIKGFTAHKVPFENLLKQDVFKLVFMIDKNKKEEYKLAASKYNVDLIFNREGYFCTIMPKGADKWHGLKKLLEIKKLKGQTIAFGDEISDLMTFRNVTKPVPMRNSTEVILNEFPNTTDSNDEDGVATYLEKTFK